MRKVHPYKVELIKGIIGMEYSLKLKKLEEIGGSTVVILQIINNMEAN